MIISTDLRSDFKNLSNFQPTADYPRQQSVLEAEFGSCDEVRLLKTSEAYKDTSVSPAVYYNLLFAANSYGRITIDDQSMEMIIKPLGAGEDGLNQRQTMGKVSAHVKLSLMDLEAYGESYGDKGQAQAA